MSYASRSKWQAYGQAKTANALFANALSRRLRERGGLAFSVHPGGIFTPLQRHLPKEEMIALGWLDESGEPSELAKQGFKTPEQGASTTLWAATSAKLEGKPGSTARMATSPPRPTPTPPPRASSASTPTPATTRRRRGCGTSARSSSPRPESTRAEGAPAGVGGVR